MAAGPRSPPIVFGALSLLPAVIVVGVLAIAARVGSSGRSSRRSPLGYDDLLPDDRTMIGLFCAAQAPELFARDQRHGMLAALLRPGAPPERLRARAPARLRTRAAGPPAPADDDPPARPGAPVDRCRRGLRRQPPDGAGDPRRGDRDRRALRRPRDGRLRLHAAAGVCDGGDHRRVHPPARHRRDRDRPRSRAVGTWLVLFGPIRSSTGRKRCSSASRSGAAVFFDLPAWRSSQWRMLAAIAWGSRPPIVRDAIGG